MLSGATSLAEGNMVEARRQFEQALVAALAYRSPFYMSDALKALAFLAADEGDVIQVATTLGSLERWCEESGAKLPHNVDRAQYDGAVASTRRLLGDHAFEKAWQEGRAKSLDEAATSLTK